MLTPFGEGLWLAEGAEVAGGMGFLYPTRMAVIRLAAGGLVVWSPVALTEPLRRDLAELGPVRHIVAPNRLHNLFVAEWQRAFPAATTHVAPGLPERCPDLAYDARLSDTPPPDWEEEMDQILFPNRIATEAVFFHRPSRTALFTDLLQCMPPGRFRGWRGLVARLDGMTGTSPQVPRKFRLAMTDRTAARSARDRILGWAPERVVMAHGTPVETGGTAAIARAFRWLG